MKSWIEIDPNSDFSIYNIPFGIGVIDEMEPRIVSRLGDYVIDLSMMANLGFFDREIIDDNVFVADNLNGFISKGKSVTNYVRERIQHCFTELEDNDSKDPLLAQFVMQPYTKVRMLLPLLIGDYTDFYSSIEHATNVGTMFRDPANALLPNWRHIPVGYHGRASSIVVSGCEIHRPMGQLKPLNSEYPIFSQSAQLDFELETAFVIGKGNSLGNRISSAEAEDHIFGMVLFNDLSARDIQSWEYVPLGPFLSKNFASVISPWVVTMEALESYRCSGPQQQPEVLPYLRFEGEKNFDIQLEVILKPENSKEKVVCNSNFKYMYWNMSQQLAHHTINGCNMRVGDLCGSGTISGSQPGSYGSMLELTWKGTKPIVMPDGSERKFADDNDTIIMTGFCEKDDIRVGFGEVSVKIIPAID